jgi:glucose/arabinose dehydrogenase
MASLAAVRVAGGFDYPVYVASPPGDDRLFVVEQQGVVKIVRNGIIYSPAFLDISTLVYPPSPAEERGLLGIAFHPDFAANGFFYVKYNDLAWDTVIARYEVSSNPNRADPGSGVILMTIAQSGPNHKGGTLLFGPNDGYLYIGMGDGGGYGDPLNHAQRDDVLLGKMLRIDVDGAFPYAIPPGNPFAGPGLPLDEIWAKGFRNPYRWSFDRATGDLFIGDVGQSMWEEVDYQPAASKGGENYGWRLMEADDCYDPPQGCNPDTLVAPIHAYQHIYHCAVIGGYVYRGSAIPGIQGTYFFGDFCTGSVWSFRYQSGQVTQFVDRTLELSPKGEIGLISAFGEDHEGELYIVDRGEPGTGEIYKIVAAAVGVEEDEGAAPVAGLRLAPAIPNPFRGTTRMTLATDSARDLVAAVYSATGQMIARLIPAPAGPATMHLEWDGRDSRGARCAAGTYFVRVRAGEATAEQRLVLIR